MTKIFVGNLSYQVTESELEAAFAEFGVVDRVSIVRDRDTGQPRGFAFVEMPDSAAAAKAIEGMNGRELNGRKLNVNEARPREDRRPSTGGGGFGDSRGPKRSGGGSGGGGRGGFPGGRREPRW